MADRKLNEVTKVTDMAYVPVIMADGSIGQIAKSDLASVVAGVMGIKEKTNQGASNWFDYKFDTGVSDANDFMQLYGTTTITGTTSNNTPELGRGILHNMSYNDANIVQTCYMISGTGSFYSSYVRCYHNTNGWSAWQRLDNFGYNSLAELSAGVAEQNRDNNIKIIILEDDTSLKTGFTKGGLYKWMFTSKNYTIPLFFIFTDSLSDFGIKILNETWYSKNVYLSIDSNTRELVIRYTGGAATVCLEFVG